MKCRFILILSIITCLLNNGAFSQDSIKSVGLKDIQLSIEQNSSVIIESFNQRITQENLNNAKAQRLPEVDMNGTTYLKNTVPLNSSSSSKNSILYNFNINSEVDLYTGGAHKAAIECMKSKLKISDEQAKAVKQQVMLEAYILLYDIYRDIKYLDFIQSSILLREKEYERIEQLYKNGVVLKSDLLRSKLYITDLQKDNISIKNSIKILSDKFTTLLGIKFKGVISPSLEGELNNHITNNFDYLFNFALLHSSTISIMRENKEYENLVLKGLNSELLPHVKLYGKYGIGSAQPYYDFNHQIGGEIGAKVNFSISSFYKSKHQRDAQRNRILQTQIQFKYQEDQLQNSLFSMYTRYQESLVNIQRAKEKIEMAQESARILHNSYYNQQSLLIDVLESESKSMQASFELVEAIVDSQKYYWSIMQICGYLN